MIIAYLALVFSILLFCRNAGLGQLAWERHAILFIIAVPTVAFCATALGAVVLYLMLATGTELLRAVVRDYAASRTQLVPI